MPTIYLARRVRIAFPVSMLMMQAVQRHPVGGSPLKTSSHKSSGIARSTHSEPGNSAKLGSKGGRRRTVYSLDGLKSFLRQRAPPTCGICWLIRLSESGVASWTQS